MQSKIGNDLEKLVYEATKHPTQQIPGLVFQCVNRDGEVLCSTASGNRGLEDQHPMTTDTLFWIASCTKMITAIALMQLVEQGKADLDDAELLETILPELKTVKILGHDEHNGQRVLTEKTKKNRITLKMLATHTAGFGYSFFSQDLWAKMGRDPDSDEFQNRVEAIQQPLQFEPGTGWAYSIGVDWIGIFIERVSKMPLGQYFKENIFGPLGIKHTTFAPTPEMRSQMAGMHERDDTGKVIPRVHLLKAARQDIPDDAFNSGGAGLVSNAEDYSRIIAMLLNDGASPTTGSRILQKASIDKMFTNQIPEWNQKYARAGYDVSRPDLASLALVGGLPINGKQGWGVNFLLSGDRLQRGGAPGLSNCFWGLDREKGIGGIILAQILPFGDPHVAPLWDQLQARMFSQ